MIREIMTVLSDNPDICNYDVDQKLLQMYPEIGCCRFHCRVNDCLNTLRRQNIAEQRIVVDENGRRVKLWRLATH